jgi:hypothetical protein
LEERQQREAWVGRRQLVEGHDWWAYAIGWIWIEQVVEKDRGVVAFFSGASMRVSDRAENHGDPWVITCVFLLVTGLSSFTLPHLVFIFLLPRKFQINTF